MINLHDCDYDYWLHSFENINYDCDCDYLKNCNQLKSITITIVIGPNPALNLTWLYKILFGYLINPCSIYYWFSKFMLFFPQCIVKSATTIVHIRMDVNWYTCLQMDTDVIVFVVHLLLQNSDLLIFWITVIMKIAAMIQYMELLADFSLKQFSIIIFTGIEQHDSFCIV